MDSFGNLYIADQMHQRIRRVDVSSGIITTVAGNGGFGFSGDGGQATQATLYFPEGVAADADGNIFIADTYNNRIRRVDKATGVISTVAGNGQAVGLIGDGGPATQAPLANPTGVAVDAAGNLYIADSYRGLGGDVGHRVRRVAAANQVISTVAGTGTAGYSGDGGPAITSPLNQPRQVAVDSQGNLFIADSSNRRVRRVDAVSGTITSIFSSPASLPLDAVCLDRFGNIYFAMDNQVKRIAVATGIVKEVFGAGGVGAFEGDGGPARLARLSAPSGIAVDVQDRMYVADRGNYRVRLGSPAWGLYPVTPCRLIDTRSQSSPALVAGSNRTFGAPGQCGLSNLATAISFNITVTQATNAGNLRIFPSTASPPLVSVINYSPGQTRANNGVVSLDSNGAFTVRCDQSTGSVQLIMDVNGYFVE